VKICVIMNDLTELTNFAKRYAKAWCSQNPESVAAFFAENGSLSVNEGTPAIGRAAIAEIARGFMRDFPDMVVTFDKLDTRDDATAFHWTLTGTNTGPGGTGKCVRISGYELWKIDNDGFIAESKGHFDAAEYERQLKHGVNAVWGRLISIARRLQTSLRVDRNSGRAS
jgi:uncharacterized protein (TIGR02246 family)